MSYLSHMNEQSPIAQELRAIAPQLPYPAAPMPATVPAGYFEKLPTVLLDRIKRANEELPPLLQTLQYEQSKTGGPYRVPAGYFDEPVSTGPAPARVVPLTRQRWFRMAAAAAIAGVLLVSSLLYRQSQAINIDAQPADWVREETKQVATDNIDHYLQENMIESTAAADSKKDIAALVSDLSVQEIQELLHDVDQRSLQLN